MMKRSAISPFASMLLLASAFCNGAEAPPNPVDKPGFTLVFQEEFDESTLNAEKWLTHYLPHWTNTLTRAQTDYTVTNGILTLRLQRGRQGWSYQDHNGNCVVSAFQSYNKPHWHRYTRSRTLTHHTHSDEIANFNGFTQKYGYWEMRVKFHKGGGGGHFAWWTVGDHADDTDNTGTTRRNSEFDIIETWFTNSSRNWYRNIHPWDDQLNMNHSSKHGDNRIGLDVSGIGPNSPNDLDDEFHIYAMHWTPHGVEWYFDNTYVDTAYIAPRYPHGMIVALYTGCRNGPNSVWPKTTQIDYIRVWAANEGYVEHPLERYRLENRCSRKYLAPSANASSSLETKTLSELSGQSNANASSRAGIYFVKPRNGNHVQLVAKKEFTRSRNTELGALARIGEEDSEVALRRVAVDNTIAHWQLQPVANTNGEWFRIVSVTNPNVVLYEDSSRVRWGVIAEDNVSSHWKRIAQNVAETAGY